MKKVHYRKLLEDEERRRKNVVKRVENLLEEIASVRRESIGLSSRLMISEEEKRKLNELRPVLYKMEDAIRKILNVGDRNYGIYSRAVESQDPVAQELARVWIEICSIMDWDYK